MNSWDNAVRRHAKEFMREWRAKEARAAEGRLRDMRRRLEQRLAWYQRDKPTRKGEDNAKE